MYPKIEEPKKTYFAKTTLQPLDIYINAEIEGYSNIEIIHRRSFLAPDTRVEPVNAQGLLGTFYTPKTRGPHPGLILLSGSSGQSAEIKKRTPGGPWILYARPDLFWYGTIAGTPTRNSIRIFQESDQLVTNTARGTAKKNCYHWFI
ncbi:hypothetical protein KDK_71120 [Dictyobacter kobayashii]|uniref:Uncharacterized protein n=1 Tax=Dictyobacter kobayashii TaxID=2014872 RepID=A0A402AW08_9CHLR|nr:hypothetical protein KDK_71120 [Dictyobacter kobayashii]